MKLLKINGKNVINVEGIQYITRKINQVVITYGEYSGNSHVIQMSEEKYNNFLKSIEIIINSDQDGYYEMDAIISAIESNNDYMRYRE